MTNKEQLDLAIQEVGEYLQDADADAVTGLLVGLLDSVVSGNQTEATAIVSSLFDSAEESTL